MTAQDAKQFTQPSIERVEGRKYALSALADFGDAVRRAQADGVDPLVVAQQWNAAFRRLYRQQTLLAEVRS